VSSHTATAFEFYPPCWFDDSIKENEGWYSLCYPCAEYVIHTRPGGGWVACNEGDLSIFDCSRCGGALK
jgi:hypothetical protein